MRPHRLELQAFGAFPGRVELDLDELGRNGLLLLCGDTGGGKTTLLDALGFALYGVVPGERQKARDDLRSHHAAPGEPTWLRLEFTARGRRLRVTRTPEHVRAAKRGGGTTKEQASARLEQWAGGRWEPVAQRLDEVGLEIGRLVGMDAAQFFQVVLLPQGRFAAFLQADHKDREKLLKQLFHVRRFEHVERWLADRSAEAATRLEQARGRLTTVAARLAQQAAVELPADLEACPEWAEEVALAAGAERAALAAGTAARLAERTAAEAALREAVELRRRLDERAATAARLAELRAEEPAVTALRHALDAAERAVPVAVAVAAVGRCVDDLDAARAEERTARAEVGRAGGPVEATAEALRAAAGAARTELGRLEALHDVLRRAEHAEQEARAAADEAARLAQERAALETQLADELLPASLVAEQRVAAAGEAASALPALQVRLESAQHQERRRADAAAAQAKAERLAAEAVSARHTAEQLAERAVQLRTQRVDAMAAELAAALVDGAECPVCGSLEHPAVAEVRTHAVTREATADADAAAAQAAREAARLEAEAAALAERASVLAADLPADAADLPWLEREVAGVAAGAADLPAATTALQAVQAQVQAVRERALTAELGVREHERTSQAAAARALADRARLHAALGEGVDLAARLGEVQQRAAACEAAAHAAERTAAASDAARAAQVTADALASANGFAGSAQAQAAARDDAWRADARDAVIAYGEELAAVQARLADPELAVPPDAEPDVDRLAGVTQEAAAAHEQAVRLEGVAAEREQRLVALVPEWQAAQAALPALRAHATELRALAELAAGRGGNRLSMPLSTFVLAARLEEVAAAASVRLARMTEGRYTLVHTDTGRDRRSRAGLGLQVEDAWTGRLRDTATLSGGETFMTALALALGLADVVTAEAGGQTIDALFVDEGFGSLDATTLDGVMDVLDELRSGGRLVGLVSHVADLRVRIPTQVLVEKGTGGSTVRTTLDAA